jgi:hypothetical protein
MTQALSKEKDAQPKALLFLWIAVTATLIKTVG